MRILLTLLLLFVWSKASAYDVTKTPTKLYDPLVDTLLSDAAEILGVPLPEGRPTIMIAPRDQIVAAYCESMGNDPTCENVAAITNRDTGEIVMSSGFLPNNAISVSILFHELVHWIQIKNHMFNGDSDCASWARSEMHAYHAQSQWLQRMGFRPIQVVNLVDQCTAGVHAHR